MSTAQRFVALDLGTARTRSLSLSGFAIVDRPSSVTRPPAGSGLAAALWPVRHGMVADPDACRRLVQRLLQDAQVSGSRPRWVLAGVPVAASPGDRRAVRAAVAEAAGCEVGLMEEPLAAAVGAGLDILDSRPCLVLDVGAGIVEAVAIADGAVTDAVALQLNATTGEGLVSYALEGVIEMTAGLVRRLPAASRPAARERGLTVTGGGAHQEQLLARLRAALRLPVTATHQPQHATIRGLMRLCLQPALTAALAPRVR
ncbi:MULTISPECIES: rod shape-determining protein [unclassified Nonomuraea]|uniref:rod shape-determining protein n=1 Tax=unclassified Nonomuraea TaxID=2593643 RepID=UPI0033DB26A9